MPKVGTGPSAASHFEKVSHSRHSPSWMVAKPITFRNKGDWSVLFPEPERCSPASRNSFGSGRFSAWQASKRARKWCFASICAPVRRQKHSLSAFWLRASVADTRCGVNCGYTPSMAGGGSALGGVCGAGLATAAGGGVCLSHGAAPVSSSVLVLSTTSQASLMPVSVSLESLATTTRGARAGRCGNRCGACAWHRRRDLSVSD